MNERKIAIIGVGGRTGTMFAFEFQKAEGIKVLGIGKDIEKIKNKKLFVQRSQEPPELFEGEVILDSQFSGDSLTEIIFLATKNPVGPAVQYYYQKIKDYNPPSHPQKERLPTLVLSQNGISAIEEARRALREVLKEREKEVQIIRVSLFNPVDSQEIDDKIYINYFLPIRLVFGVASGPENTETLHFIFQKAKIEAEEISPKDVKNTELSKLLTNLIGMASVAKGLSIEDGFKDKETFLEEIRVIKEYLRVVKASGGKLLNLPHYPIKLLSILFSLPEFLLLFFRQKLGKLISKGRGKKPKGNLDEVDYYNGAVIKLGKELGISTPVNEKIIKKVKEILKP